MVVEGMLIVSGVLKVLLAAHASRLLRVRVDLLLAVVQIVNAGL